MTKLLKVPDQEEADVLRGLCAHSLKHQYKTHTFIHPVQVSDNGPEERSLLDIVVHAGGHQLSQLCAVWGSQLALGFIKPLLLLSEQTFK